MSDSIEMAIRSVLAPDGRAIFEWGHEETPTLEEVQILVSQIAAAVELAEPHDFEEIMAAPTPLDLLGECMAERDRLRAAIEDYRLWEPGRAGHAAAHRKLMSALE